MAAEGKINCESERKQGVVYDAAGNVVDPNRLSANCIHCHAAYPGYEYFSKTRCPKCGGCLYHNIS